MNFDSFQADCRTALEALKKKYPSIELHLEVTQVMVKDMPPNSQQTTTIFGKQLHVELYSAEEFEQNGLSCVINSKILK